MDGTRPKEVFADPRTRALAEAAGRGDAAEIVRLVKAGADPNGRGRDGVVTRVAGAPPLRRPPRSPTGRRCA